MHLDKILADTDNIEPADFAALAFAGLRILVVVPIGVAHCARPSQCWVSAPAPVVHAAPRPLPISGDLLTIASSRLEVDDRYGRGGGIERVTPT